MSSHASISDVEHLKDMIVRALEQSGSLARIRADLRASVYTAIDHPSTGTKDSKSLRSFPCLPSWKCDPSLVHDAFGIVMQFLNAVQCLKTVDVLSCETAGATIPSDDELSSRYSGASDCSLDAPLLLQVLSQVLSNSPPQRDLTSSPQLPLSSSAGRDESITSFELPEQNIVAHNIASQEQSVYDSKMKESQDGKNFSVSLSVDSNTYSDTFISETDPDMELKSSVESVSEVISETEDNLRAAKENSSPLHLDVSDEDEDVSEESDEDVDDAQDEDDFGVPFPSPDKSPSPRAREISTSLSPLQDSLSSADLEPEEKIVPSVSSLMSRGGFAAALAARGTLKSEDQAEKESSAPKSVGSNVADSKNPFSNVAPRALPSLRMTNPQPARNELNSSLSSLSADEVEEEDALLDSRSPLKPISSVRPLAQLAPLPKQSFSPVPRDSFPARSSLTSEASSISTMRDSVSESLSDSDSKEIDLGLSDDEF